MNVRVVRFGIRALGLALAVGLLAGCTDAEGPIAVLTAPVVTGPSPLDVAFDLSYSVLPDDLSATYELHFGDGSAAALGSDLDVIVHHVYDAGTYEAVLTLTDAHGDLETDRLTITADESGPPVGILVGDSAPDFTAHTTDGGVLTLSDHRGEIVLLDFWG
ncbi:MAG: PKD domain-containing protein, partial [Candidatus Bipolaricaulis sp.]|nr:PKD domain-containing protein [Candidatus Bipolaricaulis sp.]